MTIRKIYWIRHGFSCSNARRLPYKMLTKLQLALIKDPPLSDMGEEQVRQALATGLKQELHSARPVVLASPLLRAIQTALMLFPRHKIMVCPFIHEIPKIQLLAEWGLDRGNAIQPRTEVLGRLQKMGYNIKRVDYSLYDAVLGHQALGREVRPSYTDFQSLVWKAHLTNPKSSFYVPANRSVAAVTHSVFLRMLLRDHQNIIAAEPKYATACDQKIRHEKYIPTIRLSNVACILETIISETKKNKTKSRTRSRTRSDSTLMAKARFEKIYDAISFRYRNQCLRLNSKKSIEDAHPELIKKCFA